MLGPSVVGKSAVTIRFCENKFVTVHLPTIEDTYHASAEVDGQRYACEVKDTAGQDELSLFAAQSSIGVHGYVLLYSITDVALLRPSRPSTGSCCPRSAATLPQGSSWATKWTWQTCVKSTLRTAWTWPPS
eukprot:TRINITY_DN371_c0_g1_i7.p2 TRINITY_DN371_c0_g1~~TRINITY_DN371_c0_g1_i7.p2  ORF type:complete len:131 (-),score=21.96 TRINITY_DN371_c0_g1_i7:451-843(-)